MNIVMQVLIVDLFYLIQLKHLIGKINSFSQLSGKLLIFHHSIEGMWSSRYDKPDLKKCALNNRVYT